MYIIGCTWTIKYKTKQQQINAWLKDLKKTQEKNSKKEEENVQIRKIWNGYVCDGKVT